MTPDKDNGCDSGDMPESDLILDNVSHYVLGAIYLLLFGLAIYHRLQRSNQMRRMWQHTFFIALLLGILCTSNVLGTIAISHLTAISKILYSTCDLGNMSTTNSWQIRDHTECNKSNHANSTFVFVFLMLLNNYILMVCQLITNYSVHHWIHYLRILTQGWNLSQYVPFFWSRHSQAKAYLLWHSGGNVFKYVLLRVAVCLPLHSSNLNF